MTAAALDKLALEKGLPASPETERLILGSVLLNHERISEVAATLKESDFLLQKHKTIYRRMLQMSERGEKIDRYTIANELMKYGELAGVDGLSYLADLDSGLPHIAQIGQYIQIVKDKSALRRIVLASQHLMNRALTGEESPDDILAEAEEQLLGIGEDRAQADDGLVSAGDYIRNFPGGFRNFVQPAKRENGIKTGFLKFDEMTGGFRPGELTILGARPGAGKSAWSSNVAWFMARRGIPVALFSLEMSTESILLRILCGTARVDSQRLRTGYLNQNENAKILAAANEMVDAPLYVDDSSSLGLMELHAKVRRFEHQTKQKLGLIIVDYLQLMASRGKPENRNQEVSKLSRGLKMFTKKDQLNVPILALSQLARESEKRSGDLRPRLTDLRESGSIEQDADNVAFIFREEMYRKDREDLRGAAELIVAKQRNGPIGTVNLTWLANVQRFENAPDDFQEDEGTRLPYAD